MPEPMTNAEAEGPSPSLAALLEIWESLRPTVYYATSPHIELGKVYTLPTADTTEMPLLICHPEDLAAIRAATPGTRFIDIRERGPAVGSR